jgi:hypothetical protein
MSGAQKMLVGYPVDGVPAGNIGRMHATPAANVEFAAGGAAHTYVTDDIRSFGGNSGGPLCILHDNGRWYPAAIYLGGSGQTVVRAIDSEVIRLFNAAENSAATGSNNTGGGITLTTVADLVGTTNAGGVMVFIVPEAARTGGGYWQLSPETKLRASGSTRGDLNPGDYVLKFTTATGFAPPSPDGQTVKVIAGKVTKVVYSYDGSIPPLGTWRVVYFETDDNTGPAADTADPDGDGDTNIDEYAAGTDPTDPTDFLRAGLARRDAEGFAVTASGKAGRVYELQINADLVGDDWTTVDDVGPLSADGPVELSDDEAPAGEGFYRIRVSRP